MNNIPTPAHDSSLFTWDKNKRQFATEASTIFGGINAPTARLERIAGEVGFRMRSARTGKVAWFAAHHREFDGGDDLLFTIYRCVEHGVSAIVYND